MFTRLLFWMLPLSLHSRRADLRLGGSAKLCAVRTGGRLEPLKALVAQSPFHVLQSFSPPEVGGNMTLSRQGNRSELRVLTLPGDV